MSDVERMGTLPEFTEAVLIPKGGLTIYRPFGVANGAVRMMIDVGHSQFHLRASLGGLTQKTENVRA